MPLKLNALQDIRASLERIAQKQKAPIIAIGELSTAQLTQINSQRAAEDLPPIIAEVLFDGRHLYKSRCIEDGYPIDEVLEQIRAAFDDASLVKPGWQTVLISSRMRIGRGGLMVRDEAVFECHGRLPHPELLSVIPRGDGKNHTKTKRATP